MKTEFGAEMTNCIDCWDLYLSTKDYDSAKLCQAQWEVYQMAVKQTEKERAGENYIDNDFVIANEFGGCVENRTYRDIYEKVLKAAGVRYLHFHCLRHTFATRALEAGFDIKSLSDILGHADASTTLNRYGHALPDHKRTAMEKLNHFFE